MDLWPVPGSIPLASPRPQHGRHLPAGRLARLPGQRQPGCLLCDVRRIGWRLRAAGCVPCGRVGSRGGGWCTGFIFAMASKLVTRCQSFEGPTTHTAAQPCTLCTAAGAVAADQVVNAHKYVHHVWTAIVLVLVTALFVVASLLPLLDPWATAAGLLTGEPVEDSGGWWAVWERGLLRPCGAKEEAVQACHDGKFSGQALGYRRDPNDAPGQPCCRCCTPPTQASCWAPPCCWCRARRAAAPAPAAPPRCSACVWAL